MKKGYNDNDLFRGLWQSEDGVAVNILETEAKSITFEATFGLSDPLIDCIQNQPEHIVFSERSRIARLGIQIMSEFPNSANLDGNAVTLKLVATSVIPGYPSLEEFSDFLSCGLPVGRLVFCDPEALLTSDEVLDAIERSELKLPASTTISSDGRIIIAPHKVVCSLREPLNKKMLGQILLSDDGRRLLNRYQVRNSVPAVSIAPGEGVVTTCSMYLNHHYVVLQSDFELGRNLPATVLDPIKTRGIRIYLEIANQSEHPIVNPLISAKVYCAAKSKKNNNYRRITGSSTHFNYHQMQDLKKHLEEFNQPNCHFLDRPMALVRNHLEQPERPPVFLNGPPQPCDATRAVCALARRDFSPDSACGHVYATAGIADALKNEAATLAVKYFPNIIEHRDIINFASEGKIEAMYFFEPSYEHGPFLSQMDHNRLLEYHAFGLDIFWVSGLSGQLMVHTIRDGMGYFVVPERVADFHKSMLFAFYGSNQKLSSDGVSRLGQFLDALIGFWGKNIGIVTGGGSGVMEQANTLARERGILSGANFLDITDQSMTTDVDFCQVFQSTCRHSRQKWFEVAPFAIFNVGGLGSLEELGITLCNMKLSILEPVPVILFDTEGDGRYWKGVEHQIKEMVLQGRAPAWIEDNITITGDPQVVIDTYRDRLQLF